MKRTRSPSAASSILAALFLGAAAGAAAAGGAIVDCVQSPSELVCETRRQVTLDVTYGLPQRLELVRLDESDPPSVAEVVRVELTKTVPRLVWPLRYFHSVIYTVGADPPQVGELRWSGYEVLPPRESFAVHVKVVRGVAPDLQVQQFDLTPQRPLVAPEPAAGDPNPFALRAMLLSDGAPLESAPELGNHVLYVPDRPAEHPYVADWVQHAMLVPREEVTRDATDCDRVGSASLYLVRSEASAGRPEDERLGSFGRSLRGAALATNCLANQLADKHEADLARLILDPTAETRYLLSGMREFRRAMPGLDGPPGPPEKNLQQVVPELRFSRVLLSFDADEVRLVHVESDGLIWSAAVEDFDSLSGNGRLAVQVFNYGGLEAGYLVDVTDCSAEVEPSMAAQARLVPPGARASLDFDLHVREDLSSSHSCWVRLRSPTGRLHDELEVPFDTREHPRTLSWRVQP